MDTNIDIHHGQIHYFWSKDIFNFIHCIKFLMLTIYIYILNL
jgi:hypothetical protein